MPDLGSRTPDRAARGLGWTSIALGLPAVLAPEAFSRSIGLSGRGEDRSAALAVGWQELLVGAGLLTGKARGLLLWSRVAGDVAHLTMLRKATAGGG